MQEVLERSSAIKQKVRIPVIDMIEASTLLQRSLMVYSPVPCAMLDSGMSPAMRRSAGP